MKIQSLQRMARNTLQLNTQIVITNNQSLVIETCKKIIEYNDICLKVQSNTGMIVQVWGKRLSVSECSNENLIVKGIIDSVELIPRKGVAKC